MKFVKSIIVIIFLTGFLCVSYSQTADEIIDKYILAVGGMDKINSIQIVKIFAKTTRRDVEVPIIEYIKRPDKIRTELSMQGQTMVRAFDGTTGWGISPFRGNKDAEKMNEEETRGIKQQAQFEGQLVNYKDKGSTVELLGKDDLEGTDVYKLKLTNKDGDITTYYIDASTYLLLKEAGKRKVKEKEISTETTYGDYKSEDGYFMPHSLEIRSGSGGNVQKINIDKVEFNIMIDDGIFSMPENK